MLFVSERERENEGEETDRWLRDVVQTERAKKILRENLAPNRKNKCAQAVQLKKTVQVGVGGLGGLKISSPKNWLN